jgi:twitching motility protein PilT
MALTTAETGHLVLTTLHAPDTAESINRILDVYPPGKQNQIRTQLAENLMGIIGQNLIPLQGKEGRVLATEILDSYHFNPKYYPSGGFA